SVAPTLSLLRIVGIICSISVDLRMGSIVYRYLLKAIRLCFVPASFNSMSLHISKPQDNELARQAYAAVAEVPTVEENDRNRLGYHVWLYLRGELETLEEAVHMARTRFRPHTLPPEDVVQIISS